MTTFQIETADRVNIVAHHFVPAKRNDRVVLINPGMGIRQTFYFKYAEYLSDRGYDVITYDFRGIGMSKPESLRGFNASVADWTTKDFTAVTQYILDHFSDSVKILFGHSFGGNSLGLSPMANSYDAYVNIAAPYGYWKYFDRSYQPALLWTFYIVIPLLTAIFGYFPSKVKKLGVNLPKRVVLDWSVFVKHPDSMLEMANRIGNYYDTIDKKMLMISFSDDNISPEKAVDVMAEKVYVNAEVERLHIEADESKPLGHLNFFKERYKDELWAVPVKWIDELDL